MTPARSLPDPSRTPEHTAVSCDDGNGCTIDACDPAVGCLRLANDGQSCDDGNACTSADSCAGTECHGAAIPGCCANDADCDDASSCTDDSFSLGSCQNVPRNCAVENKCLAGYCDAGSGGACGTTAVSCDDSNVCTDDWCDPTFGCTHSPTSSPPEPAEVSWTDALLRQGLTRVQRQDGGGQAQEVPVHDRRAGGHPQPQVLGRARNDGFILAPDEVEAYRVGPKAPSSPRGRTAS